MGITPDNGEAIADKQESWNSASHVCRAADFSWGRNSFELGERLEKLSNARCFSDE